MAVELKDLPHKAASRKKQHAQLFKKLKKEKTKKVDQLFHEAHEKAFSKINCLDCGNCCRTTGPSFEQKDIARIARHLKLKPSQFVEAYLREDEDRDMVLQKVPCAFLGADNYCSIYDVRPKACREFPHTDRKNMKEILNITSKNIAICPAVFDVVEDMIREI